MGYYSTFVVRFWVEAGKMVGGTIQHVGASGKKINFYTWGKMVDFIASNLTPSLEDDTDPFKDLDLSAYEGDYDNDNIRE